MTHKQKLFKKIGLPGDMNTKNRLSKGIMISLTTLFLGSASYAGLMQNTDATTAKNSQERNIEVVMEQEHQENLEYIPASFEIKERDEREVHGDNRANNFLYRLPNKDKLEGLIRHSVNRGESLYGIASNYLDTESASEIYPFINQIVETNNLNSDIIRYGDTLLIPLDSEKRSDNISYSSLTLDEKVEFFRDRTIADAEPYIRDIIETSENNEVDARLMMAIASVESGFNPRASSVGARGIWQQMPQYHVVSDDELGNLVGAIEFIDGMYERFSEYHQDETSALISTIAGYNAGPNLVMRHLTSGAWDGRTPEEFPRNGNPEIGYSTQTRNYITRVIERLDEYSVDLF